MRESSCAVVSVLLSFAGVAAAAPRPDAPAPNVGYYRQPSLHKDTVAFVAEGDLWKVPASGGAAMRLTTHPGDEYTPQISPDGKWLAFCAEYEGPGELYVMPIDGGLPTRLTFEGSSRIGARGWTGDGKIIYSTDRFSTLPNTQLVTIDPKTLAKSTVPLAQAADGVFGDAGRLFFVRIPYNGSHTKRYKGGTIEQVWSWSGKDGEEAVNLTGEFEGTSRRPMLWNSRVYFASDRDGYMNLWSMAQDGKDVKQVTKNAPFDMAGTNLDADRGDGGGGRIVYQLGPDLHLYDLTANTDATINITLPSDFDQLREKWISKPADWITAASISPDGDRVVITARGEVVVAPAKQGRLVEATRKPGVRFRNAIFSHDGTSIIALSDQSGEVEVWRMPANGVGEAEQLTTGADVLRWSALPSPDGKSVAHNDKNQKLWIYDIESKQSVLVEQNMVDQIESFSWSRDGRWLAYVTPAGNAFPTIKIYSLDSKTSTAVTSDRFASYSPAWSADGNWLFFLSDRDLETLVPSPWGQNQPDPFLDKTTKIYAVALKPGVRWPYLPKDELETAKEKKKEEKKPEPKADPSKSDGTKPDGAKPEDGAAKKDEPAKDAKKDDKKEDKKEDKKIEVTVEGIRERLFEVPVARGNYSSLTASEKTLFFTSRDTDPSSPTNLHSFPITNDSPELKTVVDGIASYQLSQDGKKLLIRKGDAYSIVDAAAGKADLEKKGVDLSAWRLSLPPREEFRQMYTESWRLLRDYFYDPAMHGVNWKAMHDKYLPWVDRVRARAELSDVMTHLTGELSALHHFVRDGDTREGTDQIGLSSLGCVLTRDEGKGGYVIADIYESDPDEPTLAAPIARPHVGGKEGDVIEMIDGVAILSVPDPAALLRTKTGRQVLIKIKPAGGGESREAIVTPMSLAAESDLRYHHWEYTRRLKVDELGKNQIGYLHLRAMGGDDFENFVKGYYPVFDRAGIIIDVRNNRGGNIDSWILSKLMRKMWMTWSQRVGQAPNWNMQYAFRGHMVLLCNERTSSDGEAIADGFRRLGLGKVMGTRTWGGEIWLSSSNTLVDRGIASAGEFGVWGPEGTWLIEGRGVEPDFTVDNAPHATFKGEDTQLKAAVEYLQKQIAEKPVPPIQRPGYPDKSFKNK